MTNLIKKRKTVLEAFLSMGATPQQMAIEKKKTLNPEYVQEWIAVVSSK